MRVTRSTWLGLALWTLAAVPAAADAPDVWLRTKVEMALLTAEGVSVMGVNIDTVDGAVTLRGKVKTAAEKEKATLAVRRVNGVNSVRNLLQVVPDAFKSAVRATDEAVKGHVETALKSDKRVDAVKVASVSNGVVLLSGKASTLAEKRRAIDLAWEVGGVARVASEIETADK